MAHVNSRCVALCQGGTEAEGGGFWDFRDPKSSQLPVCLSFSFPVCKQGTTVSWAYVPGVL